MATTEITPTADMEISPVSLSHCFAGTGILSGFIFDVSLSTAIAADGKFQAAIQYSGGTASIGFLPADVSFVP